MIHAKGSGRTRRMPYNEYPPAVLFPGPDRGRLLLCQSDYLVGSTDSTSLLIFISSILAERESSGIFSRSPTSLP